MRQIRGMWGGSLTRKYPEELSNNQESREQMGFSPYLQGEDDLGTCGAFSEPRFAPEVLAQGARH